MRAVNMLSLLTQVLTRTLGTGANAVVADMREDQSMFSSFSLLNRDIQKVTTGG